MPLMNHEAGRDVLLEVSHVLDAFEIPFFAMQGTALGLHRDRGFVPHEQDIDLGVLAEHLIPKAMEVATDLLRRGYDVEVIQVPFTRPRTLVAWKQLRGHVVKVDIVGMVRWRNLRFTETLARPYQDEPYAIVHEASTVELWDKSIEVWGRRFNLPKEIEQYLLCEYGPSWTTPKEDHVSRTRVYNFLQREGIKLNYLERW